jgi:4-phosphopantoate--beta-alanine ligase
VHARAKAASAGIYTADVVFVPLEDGDRCEELVRMGKKVIVVDLNPLSRSAQTATVTIVDNIVRAVPNMVALAAEMKDMSRMELEEIVEEFHNEKVLAVALEEICLNIRASE